MISIRSITWVGLGLFMLTRGYIWMAYPRDFSQITEVYMPYAHLWASGVQPYLQQWYEYPPATIPLFYLPHLVDMGTLNQPWHINYGQVYRGLMLMIDVGLFALIIGVLKKERVKAVGLAVALIYYCLATAKAHDFIYDAMDLAFVTVMVVGIMAPELIRGKSGKLTEWLAYFTAVALKLINGPLGLIYAVFELKKLKQTLTIIGVSGFLIWMVPLIIFRSSLSVMLVYHSVRGLQVESVPAQIAATIGRFTQTESYINQYQSVNIVGPVSTQVKRYFDILLPLIIGGYLVWGTRVAWTAHETNRLRLRLLLTTGYLFGFMLLAKVLSTPYLIWQIPLLAIYPYKSVKQQLTVLIPSLIMIGISMTKIPNLDLGGFSLHLAIGWARSLLIGYLLWQTVQLIRSIQRTGIK